MTASSGQVKQLRGLDTSKAIKEAAADLFQRRGYEATSLRELAAAVGIQAGSLYNHIRGKDELLSMMMIEVMDDLLDALAAATAGKEDPLERLRAGLDCHIRFHAVRARDVFIGNSELRALRPNDRRKVVARRDRYEAAVHELVVGVLAQLKGDDGPDPRLHTYAILAIGAHVPSWYRADGRLSLAQLVADNTEIILRQLGVPARQRLRVSAAKAAG